MPNGPDKKLNFVPKVWDAKANDGKGAYRPLYIAPDATDMVQGDVKLSDAVDSALDAANGMTAATPKAVKAVQDKVNSKLDKVAGADQTVASKVTFKNSVVAEKGVTAPKGQYFTGDLEGNATTATALEKVCQISVGVGTGAAGVAHFNGTSNASITINEVDAAAVTKGTLPLSVIPQGAMERLVKVKDEAARLALTSATVQLGDSVLQLDTNVMYVVVDASKLDSEDGYQEYKAGSALLAETAKKVGSKLTVQKNGVPQFHYDGSEAKTINIASSFSDLTGQITATQIPDGIITSSKLGVNYAGSASKGGSANSAVKLSSARTIALSGVVRGNASFDGSSDVSITTSIGAGSITNEMLASNAVTGAKIAPSAVTSNNIANSTITPDKLVDGCVNGTKLAASSVATHNIVNGTIKLEDLSSEVGTVYVGAVQPSSSAVKIWVKI